MNREKIKNRKNTKKINQSVCRDTDTEAACGIQTGQNSPVYLSFIYAVSLFRAPTRERDAKVSAVGLKRQ